MARISKLAAVALGAAVGAAAAIITHEPAPAPYDPAEEKALTEALEREGVTTVTCEKGLEECLLRGLSKTLEKEAQRSADTPAPAP
ncbi:MAG TPA: hypothetical protein PLO23_08790 [Alphaproteobacteria bacterium]|nr:hypothetical protein [Alphaproteobacteria bacterium]